jgi:hypothetical protein
MPIRSAAETFIRSFEQDERWTLIRKTSLSSDRSDGARSSPPTYSIAPILIDAPLSTSVPISWNANVYWRRNLLTQQLSLPAIGSRSMLGDAYRPRLVATTNARSNPTLHDVRYQSDIARCRGLAAHDRRGIVFSTDKQLTRLVEPIGIEPTTSCLQSTRSPN